MPRYFKSSVIAISLLTLLSACSSINNLNPFSSGSKERSGAPQDATAYVCEGNKQFFVRMLNNGNEAWLIFPTHELALAKATGSNRYTSGAIALDINGDETTLNDGKTIAYKACKAQSKNDIKR